MSTKISRQRAFLRPSEPRPPLARALTNGCNCRKEVRRPYPHTILDGGPDDEEKRQGLARDLGFVVPPAARRVEASHNVVTQQTKSANLYIYSTAEAFDPELLREFRTDEAVVITNPDAFFRAIRRA